MSDQGPELSPAEQQTIQATEGVGKALDGLDTTQRQAVLLKALTGSVSEGISDAALEQLRTLIVQEDLRRGATNPEPTVEVKDRLNPLEAKAKELALLIRSQGAGFLYGLFPQGQYDNPYQVGGEASAQMFLKGNSVDERDKVALSEVTRFTFPVGNFEPGNHYWLKLGEVRKTIGEKFRELTDQRWQRFQLVMPASKDYDKTHRPGVTTGMALAVPPQIAEQINQEVSQNPMFPDALFKAIYPRVVGDNTETHLRRLPANQLVVRDFSSPINPETTNTVPFAEEIPY